MRSSFPQIYCERTSIEANKHSRTLGRVLIREFARNPGTRLRAEEPGAIAGLPAGHHRICCNSRNCAAGGQAVSLEDVGF